MVARANAANAANSRTAARTGHKACRDRSSWGRGQRLAVVLVSVVRGLSVALLTRADGEVEYSFTAGCRWLEEPDSQPSGSVIRTEWQRDGGCYVRAAARILAMDANIDPSEVEKRVHFFAAPRLTNLSGTPVMFGRVASQDIADFDKLSDYFDKANTKLFRVNNIEKKWRIVGRPADERRLVNEDTRELICRTLEQHPL